MVKESILIVDDEIEICTLLSSFLKSKGHVTRYATSIREGIEILKVFKPSLAFIDINLSDGLGFELIPTIRENKLANIIVISAREGKQEKKLAQLYKVDDYITKPFSRSEILNSMENLS